jgi:hypothetical protein
MCGRSRHGPWVFGLPPIAALAISAKVERGVLNRLGAGDDRVEALAGIEAQLDAICVELYRLAPVGGEVAQLERVLAHALARIEEWTA